MTHTNYFIGIDLGTSGCRAIAIDQNLSVCASSRHPLPDSTIADGHITQQPDDWWHAVQQVLKDLAATIDFKGVKALCVDGTSGSVLLCDQQGKVLSDALMYNDALCVEQAQFIKRLAPDNSGAHGNSAGLAKCLYLYEQLRRSNKRDKTENIICVTQADWISGKLQQRFSISDENNALKMGYDPINRCWPDWLSQLDCRSILPDKVLAPGECRGAIDAEIAHSLFLSLDTQVIAGTTDSIAAFIATGCNAIGDAVTSLGSTLAIKLLSDQPVFSRALGVYSHRLNNKWLVGGASNSGGAVLKQYFLAEQIDRFSEQINPDIKTALNYYPLPAIGERFPVNDPLKPIKLSPRPDNDQIFFQAILEGIAQIEKSAFDKLAELGAPYPTRIYTMGGGSKNEPWRRMRQNLCKIPVFNTAPNKKSREAAYGAALLAASNNDNGL